MLSRAVWHEEGRVIVGVLWTKSKRRDELESVETNLASSKLNELKQQVWSLGLRWNIPITALFCS
jgi:hypothetical protein